MGSFHNSMPGICCLLEFDCTMMTIGKAAATMKLPLNRLQIKINHKPQNNLCNLVVHTVLEHFE